MTSSSLFHWGLILTAASANVVLNLSLHRLARGVDVESARSLVASALLSAWFWLSFLSAVILLGAFLVAIRSFSLSLTYTAVTATAMVALTTIGAVWQMETINAMRILGLTLIVVGLLVSAFADAA